MPRLDQEGLPLNYRIPTPGLKVVDGAVRCNLQLPGFTLRYTTDGTEPTAKSPAVQGPHCGEGRRPGRRIRRTRAEGRDGDAPDSVTSSRTQERCIMSPSTSRREFLRSTLGAAAAAAGTVAVSNRTEAAVSKRDAMMALLDKSGRQPYIPAAFFIHFDPTFHFGTAAVQKHLEYFRATGMDFVKIQYEKTFPRDSRPSSGRRTGPPCLRIQSSSTSRSCRRCGAW